MFSVMSKNKHQQKKKNYKLAESSNTSLAPASLELGWQTSHHASRLQSQRHTSCLTGGRSKQSSSSSSSSRSDGGDGGHGRCSVRARARDGDRKEAAVSLRRPCTGGILYKWCSEGMDGSVFVSGEG